MCRAAAHRRFTFRRATTAPGSAQKAVRTMAYVSRRFCVDWAFFRSFCFYFRFSSRPALPFPAETAERRVAHKEPCAPRPTRYVLLCVLCPLCVLCVGSRSQPDREPAATRIPYHASQNDSGAWSRPTLARFRDKILSSKVQKPALSNLSLIGFSPALLSAFPSALLCVPLCFLRQAAGERRRADDEPCTPLRSAVRTPRSVPRNRRWSCGNR